MSRLQHGDLTSKIPQQKKVLEQDGHLIYVVRGKPTTESDEYSAYTTALKSHRDALSNVEDQQRIAQRYLGRESLTQQVLINNYYTRQYQTLIELVSTINGNHIDNHNRGSKDLAGVTIYYEDQKHLGIFNSIMKELSFDIAKPDRLTDDNKVFLEQFGTKEGYLKTAAQIVTMQDALAKKIYDSEVTDAKPLETLQHAGEVLINTSKALAGKWAQEK